MGVLSNHKKFDLPNLWLNVLHHDPLVCEYAASPYQKDLACSSNLGMSEVNMQRYYGMPCHALHSKQVSSGSPVSDTYSSYNCRASASRVRLNSLAARSTAA